jgi:1-phosphatidylinositol phosphodiesterase
MVTAQGDFSVNAKEWMKAVYDSALISEMSIPGTHDSATSTAYITFGQCQDWTIAYQLANGIRYFDIRTAWDKDTPLDNLKIVHGPIMTRVAFTEVIQSMVDHVQSNQSEGIIMRLKNDDGNENAAKECIIFKNLVDKKWKSSFLFSTSIPTLGQLRGKIWVLNNIADCNMPSPTMAWEDGNYMNVQDKYDIDIWQNIWNIFNNNAARDKKRDLIREQIQKSNNGPHTTLYVNHLSWIYGNFIPSPRDTYYHTNSTPKETSFYRNRFGIVPADFPDVGLVQTLVEGNKSIQAIRGIVSIRSIKAKKCLTDEGNGSSGTLVKLYPCNSSNKQRWIYDKAAFSFKNVSTGKMLDVKGGSYADGTNVQTYDDNQTISQKWKPSLVGLNQFKLKSNASCLDVPGGNSGDGTAMGIWSCVDGEQNQLFDFAPFPESAFLIINKGNGKCLRSEGEGSNMKQRACNVSDNNQRWVLTENSDGTFYIRNQNNQYLSLRYPNNDGDKIQSYSSTSGDGEKWLVQPASGILYQIGHKISKKCLDISNGSDEEYVDVIQQWACSDLHANQSFYLKIAQ